MGELKPCPFCGEPVELHPAIARGHYPVILHVPGVGKPVCGMDAFHLFSGGGTDHESLIEAWNARVESVNADLLEALKTSVVALDDWLHIYADDLCDAADVEESKKRVGQFGTLSYLARIQEANHAAISRANQENGK